MPLHPPQYFRKTRGEIRIGTAANKPLATDVLEGTLYLSTDTGVLQRSDGATWVEYAQTTYINLLATTITAGIGAITTITSTTITVDHLNVAVDALNLASGRIAFPATQVPSADPNTLDDYEEGSWTPALNLNASTAGITYTSRSGTYTKIGRLVEVDFVFVLSNKGASVGAATITGLPFAAGVVTTGPIDFATGIAGGATKIPFMAVSGSTLFPLYYDNVGGRNQITNTEFTNTTTLQGSIIYPV